MRPRKVFLACALREFMSGMAFKMYRDAAPWHAELEELTVRIDARLEDKGKLKNTNLVIREIGKYKGGVLRLVEGKSGVLGSWRGLDLGGEHVEWHSVTYVWRDASML